MVYITYMDTYTFMVVNFSDEDLWKVQIPVYLFFYLVFYPENIKYLSWAQYSTKLWQYLEF